MYVHTRGDGRVMNMANIRICVLETKPFASTSKAQTYRCVSGMLWAVSCIWLQLCE